MFRPVFHQLFGCFKPYTFLTIKHHLTGIPACTRLAELWTLFTLELDVVKNVGAQCVVALIIKYCCSSLRGHLSGFRVCCCLPRLLLCNGPQSGLRAFCDKYLFYYVVLCAHWEISLLVDLMRTL
ncbi:hypothetical protein AL527_14390 [Pseudomonas fulva]|nr:hypothetical protein AL527_14390 [Pseudomonas fulva]